MGLFSRPTTAPSAPSPSQALPGRAARPFAISPTHAVLGNPVEGPFPAGLQVAVFGMGCFWGAERKFWQTPGVWSTSAGYAGGRTPNPTYEEVCSGATGHVEVVQLTFNPEVIGFADILDIFFSIHDPTTKDRQGNDVGSQYRSVIFYHSEAQKTAAEQAIEELNNSGQLRGPVVTEVRPAEPFYRADASRNLDEGGVGLGLAVARSLARAHGGDVELISRPDGLTARVSLPLV